MADTNKAAVKDAAPKKEETVKIKIPRTKDENDDFYVSVNDRTWMIKRGVTVEVPRCAAKQLEHHERMLDAIYDFNEANQMKSAK